MAFVSRRRHDGRDQTLALIDGERPERHVASRPRVTRRRRAPTRLPGSGRLYRVGAEISRGRAANQRRNNSTRTGMRRGSCIEPTSWTLMIHSSRPVFRHPKRIRSCTTRPASMFASGVPRGIRRALSPCRANAHPSERRNRSSAATSADRFSTEPPRSNLCGFAMAGACCFGCGIARPDPAM